MTLRAVRKLLTNASRPGVRRPSAAFHPAQGLAAVPVRVKESCRLERRKAIPAGQVKKERWKICSLSSDEAADESLTNFSASFLEIDHCTPGSNSSADTKLRSPIRNPQIIENIKKLTNMKKLGSSMECIFHFTYGRLSTPDTKSATKKRQ